MEWSQEQLKFIEDNRGILEKEGYDEFWLRAYGQLTPFQARHLMLGVALVAGLRVELIVRPKQHVSMFVVNGGTGNSISIMSRGITTSPSDLDLTKMVDSVLTVMGVSQDLIASVIGKMKVWRA